MDLIVWCVSQSHPSSAMEHLLQLVVQLCEETSLQATVAGSLKGGAIAGATTVLGKEGSWPVNINTCKIKDVVEM